jgi:putative ATPase
MDDLFGHAADEMQKEVAVLSAPLAHRMRPERLEDWVGHENLIAPGKPLRQWLDSDRMPSIILWGPPGCGKTTLAGLIAQKTQCRFVKLSAISAGTKDLKQVGEEARAQLGMSRRKTLVFVDEIHRFNKAQQDVLLPFVESGILTLIGATTENPSFELNSALLSRVRVIRLERVPEEALVALLKRALVDSRHGLGGRMEIDEEGLRFIARSSEGDARRALTALESVAMAASEQKLGVEKVARVLADGSALARQPIPYDKDGDEHHNVVSAFIKSIRGSDPHAGLYYLARMLEGGEDPLFICRRLVILASEDVGNADPRALQIALAAKDAVDFVGMPEARIALGQAVTYLAMAPKSNAAYAGINEALAEVRSTGALPVPVNLRNNGTEKGYRYDHDSPEGHVAQRHLPEQIVGRRFYRPKELGLEIQLKEKLDRLNPGFDER